MPKLLRHKFEGERMGWILELETGDGDELRKPGIFENFVPGDISESGMSASAKVVERKTENAIPFKNFFTQNRKRNEMAKN